MMVASHPTSTHDHDHHRPRHSGAGSSSNPFPPPAAPFRHFPMASPAAPTAGSRHNSTSPTQSSPSSAASSRSAASLLKLSGLSGSAGGSWVGSDGTAATSDQGSPPVSLAAVINPPGKPAPPASAGSTAGPSRATLAPPGMASSQQLPAGGSASAAEAERLRRSVSTPSFRDGSNVRRTSPAVKRKASGSSATAKSEVKEGRSIDMRRIPTPQTGRPSARERSISEGSGIREARAGQDEEKESMKEMTASPESEKKQRRRQEGNGPAKRNDTSPHRRRRRKRVTLPPEDATPASAPAPPEEEPHIDLASYPQDDLLCLLASLLSQIANANDALRSNSGSSSHSTSTASVTALDSVAGGASSVSLVSNLSSASLSNTRRTTMVNRFKQLSTPHGTSTPEQEDDRPPMQRRQSRSPWNSMPSTPHHERRDFLSGFTSTHGSSLSHPPTPGASRPASPTATRRNSQSATSPHTVKTSGEEVFSASRTALSSASAVLAFHARNVPQISIEAYLLRILKYCPTSNEVFISLLVYFDRMAKTGALNGKSVGGSPVEANANAGQRGQADADDDGKPFAIDSYNVHRLVIAGVTVASKFFSDVFYTNSRYAKVGGLPLHELDQLELQFLLINDFRLVIPLEEMQRYADQLLMYWDGAKGTSGYREPKPAPPASPTREDDRDWDSGSDGKSSDSDDDADDFGDAEDGTEEDTEPTVRVVAAPDPPVSQAAPTESGPSRSASLRSPSTGSVPQSGDALEVHRRPFQGRSRPSTSGASIASAQSSEASASTVTPGTPRIAADLESGDDDDEEDDAMYDSDEDARKAWPDSGTSSDEEVRRWRNRGQDDVEMDVASR